jgi:HEAT repeat protein
MSAFPMLLLFHLATSPVQARPRDLKAAAEDMVAAVQAFPDVLRAAEALADLGPGAAQPMFERLCANRAGDAPLGQLQVAALHAALARLPREDCLALLERETRASDDRRREVALDVLGTLGGRNELKLALDLGAPAGREAPPDATLGAALERALLGLCEREEGTVRALAAFLPRVPPAARVSIAAVVARAGREAAASLLAERLGSAGVEADAILLLALARLGRSSDREDDLLLFERVRGMLGHPDARLRVLACVACEKLRDHEAVPDLVVMLDDRDPNLRRRAHAALRSLTGQALPADPGGWLAWLSAGLSWWDERAETCRVALVSGTAAEAAASVQELARQRLFVHHCADILALALQRPEPDVVKSACRALGATREPAALRALLTVADHPDPSVAAEARAALHRLEHAKPNTTRPNSNLPRLRNSS